MKNPRLKALLLIDWYNAKVIYICLILIAVFSGSMALSYTADKGSVTPVLFGSSCVIASMLISMVFNYDEYKNMGLLKKSMPYTCREIVLARYIPPAFLAGSVALMTVLGSLIGGAIHGSFNDDFGGQLAFSVFMTELYCLGMPALFYPFFFTLGYRKVQSIFTFVFIILMAGSAVIQMIGMIGSNHAETGETLSDTQLFTLPMPVGVILTAVMAGLYYLSYRIAVEKYAESDN